MQSVEFKDVKQGMILWESINQGNYQFKAVHNAMKQQHGYSILAERNGKQYTMYCANNYKSFIYTEPAYIGVPTHYLGE